MRNIKIHEFRLGIYPRTIWIAVTKESDIDGFDELCKIDDTSYASTEEAHDKNSNRCGVFIRFTSKKCMTNEVIAHESCHAAMFVFNYIGAEVDMKGQECFSYLVGFIAKCCDEVRRYKEKK